MIGTEYTHSTLTDFACIETHILVYTSAHSVAYKKNEKEKKNEFSQSSMQLNIITLEFL